MKNQNRNKFFLYFLGGMVIVAFTFLYSHINTKDSLAYTGRDLQLDDLWSSESTFPTTKISYNQKSCIQIETVNQINTGSSSVYTLSKAVVSASEIPAECVNPDRNAFRKIELNGALNFHFQKYSISSDLSSESAMYTVTVESFNGVLEPQSCKNVDPEFSAGAQGNADLSVACNTEFKESFFQRLRNRFKAL